MPGRGAQARLVAAGLLGLAVGMGRGTSRAVSGRRLMEHEIPADVPTAGATLFFVGQTPLGERGLGSQTTPFAVDSRAQTGCSAARGSPCAPPRPGLGAQGRRRSRSVLGVF